jgi:diguanylate cyclase (GGDEF)-like protein
MDFDGSFAFLLPFIFLTFGGLLLLVSRWGEPAAQCWGIGYLCSAGGFVAPSVFPDYPAVMHATLADALFLGAAYCYSEALFLHFRPVRFRRLRVGFPLAIYLATLYATLIEGSLHAELLFGDIGFAGLLTFALAMNWKKARQPVERLLLCIVVLVILDCVVRNVALVVIVPSSDGLDTFSTSTYAFAMRATSAMLGIVLALAALATVALNAIAHYRDAAERDPLTRLLNRRGFERAVGTDCATIAGRVVIIADIDHFKTVNDQFGHAKGDMVLSAFADILRALLPGKASISRFGGEEFVACLSGATLSDGEHLANTIRIALEDREWVDVGIDGKITASFGVGCPAAGDHSIHDAIARADTALYAAKSAGRNRVVADSAPGGRPAPLRVVSVA